MISFRFIPKFFARVTMPLIALSLFSAFAVAVKPACAEDSDTPQIQINCFKENRDAGNYKGKISVSKLEYAGQSCNTTFYDCDGKCFGCYFDEDQSKPVCYDNTGTIINK
jgi:hypothetical protein